MRSFFCLFFSVSVPTADRCFSTGSFGPYRSQNYPRLLRPRVRFKEFRSCQITSAPLRYFVNFEDAFYYHIFMKTVLQLMGVYEKGKRNALQVKTSKIVFYFHDLPPSFENYTILFLTDLHLDGLDGLTEKVQALVRMQPVELCIFGGDLRMDTHGPFTEALPRFQRLLGIFAPGTAFSAYWEITTALR